MGRERRAEMRTVVAIQSINNALTARDLTVQEVYQLRQHRIALADQLRKAQLQINNRHCFPWVRDYARAAIKHLRLLLANAEDALI